MSVRLAKPEIDVRLLAKAVGVSTAPTLVCAKMEVFATQLTAPANARMVRFKIFNAIIFSFRIHWKALLD